MTWHTGALCAIDAETTGVDIESDRIVTWSRWTIDPAQGKKVHSGWLINPGIDIPDEAAAIHGITTEHAQARGQHPASAVREIAGDLLHWAEQGAVTVAYNAPFDLSLLHRECLRYGHHREAAGIAAIRPVVDPLVLDKAVDKYRKGSRKLVDAARHYGIDLAEEDAHGSAADSLAAARVAYVIASRYDHIGRMPVADLHGMQVEWKRDQAAGLERWLRKNDPAATVARDWPFIPAPAVVQEQIR
ncbi:exonuclease domain-containing protein [Nocardiopsis changdeensis]|uniref:3'-5' exonuclease n=1 Tax=Nocardiopsis changdeensis TaxID=2831969 RepID=A0ABX8BLX3_9ACTN|nr:MULTISPECIES: exonuclease domain-containing protein [Nocardiopsis]QUX23007.1 3'-5' exonuclease [Nocardiopsis changdeensis]QYX38950.1 3'-5' exonuclease [Nocardiopsis sp. MT53]